MKPTPKTFLRKLFLDHRRMLDDSIYRKRNEQLCKNLLTFIQKSDYKVIHTFLPINRNREPDITGILADLRKLDCELMTSMTNFKNKSQQHFYLKADTQLENNSMGIPEPVNADEADIEQVDLILVPLLAADKKGNRIGYGGGYYDRLLKETSATKVGLSLSPPLDEIIQTEDWDIALDKVITPFE